MPAYPGIATARTYPSAVGGNAKKEFCVKKVVTIEDHIKTDLQKSKPNLSFLMR